jgi:hypothetical protein
LCEGPELARCVHKWLVIFLPIGFCNSGCCVALRVNSSHCKHGRRLLVIPHL